MHTVFRFLAFLVFFLLLPVVALAVFLLCFDVRVPRSVVDRVETALSSSNTLVRIEDVSVRFPDSLWIGGVRVFTREKPGTKPFLSAREAIVRLAWRRLSLSPAEAVESVTVTDLRMPRVNEGYYIPDSIEFPGSPDYTEKNEPLQLELPAIRPFRLTLVRPDVLGVRATEITATVSSRRDCLRVDEISLSWPDMDSKMTLAGECVFDVGRQLVKGHVHGQARQHNIRPLLVALDITNSLPFMDAFTGVEPPVDATCRWDVNLVNNDLHIALDLHPSGGAYRKVPLKDVHGAVDIRVFVRDHFQNARITVGPLSGTLADGTTLKGSVVYENTNDVGCVHFNAFSTARPQDVLAIANTLNDGTLDCLQIDEGAENLLRGRLAVLPRHADMNDLKGSLAFAKGTFFDIPLRNASMTYTLKRTTVAFSEARARLPAGGVITGGGFIDTPGMTSTNATYGVDLACERVPFTALAEVLGRNADGRSGLVNGSLALRGPIGAAASSGSAATGKIAVTEGNLRQFNFFNGLIGLIAKVPGLDKVREFANENNDSASADFRLEKGVLTLSNVSITGGTLSIAGEGSYVPAKNALDFRLRVRLIRPDTIHGRLLSWLTEPVSKTLFQVRLTGSLEDPNWAWDPDMLSILPQFDLSL